MKQTPSKRLGRVLLCLSAAAVLFVAGFLLGRATPAAKTEAAPSAEELVLPEASADTDSAAVSTPTTTPPPGTTAVPDTAPPAGREESGGNVSSASAEKTENAPETAPSTEAPWTDEDDIWDDELPLA